MTHRELVLAALEHHATETVPYHIELTAQAGERLIAHTGDPQAAEKLPTCLHYTQYWGWPTELPDRPEHYLDEFGVIWNRSGADKDIGVIDNPLIEDLEERSYVFPKANIARLRRDIEHMLAAKDDKFVFMGFGFCMFERAWSLMGMENVLISMLTCPDELEQLFDDICDYFLKLVHIALEYDIDGIYFGDDWGQQQGLIMGPELWRKFIKSRMARLYAPVKKAGKYVMQHSCGDCSEIFTDLIEIGLDCYQTFQPEIYDLAKMKALYGDKLAFWGGISTQQALPSMTPDQVKQEVRRVMEILRPNGGLIVAPAHAIPFDVPPENILAMADVFLNQ